MESVVMCSSIRYMAGITVARFGVPQEKKRVASWNILRVLDSCQAIFQSMLLSLRSCSSVVLSLVILSMAALYSIAKLIVVE